MPEIRLCSVAQNRACGIACGCDRTKPAMPGVVPLRATRGRLTGSLLPGVREIRRSWERVSMWTMR